MTVESRIGEHKHTHTHRNAQRQAGVAVTLVRKSNPKCTRLFFWLADLTAVVPQTHKTQRSVLKRRPLQAVNEGPQWQRKPDWAVAIAERCFEWWVPTAFNTDSPVGDRHSHSRETCSASGRCMCGVSMWLHLANTASKGSLLCARTTGRRTT